MSLPAIIAAKTVVMFYHRQLKLHTCLPSSSTLFKNVFHLPLFVHKTTIVMRCTSSSNLSHPLRLAQTTRGGSSSHSLVVQESRRGSEQNNGEFIVRLMSSATAKRKTFIETNNLHRVFHASIKKQTTKQSTKEKMVSTSISIRANEHERMNASIINGCVPELRSCPPTGR